MERSAPPFSRAMSRGKVIYPDPETFNPGRFVKGGGTNFEIQDPEKSCLVTEGGTFQSLPSIVTTPPPLVAVAICVLSTFYSIRSGKRIRNPHALHNYRLHDRHV